MQVIHELRHGVKLRKVSSTQSDPSSVDSVSFTGATAVNYSMVRRNIEYELTPFEILLDQIRARRYRLKKVSRENALGAAIKKDARDIILDFIRSRPPLKKSSQRKQKPLAVSKSQPVNLHEQLMVSIRNYSTPLRRVDLKLNSAQQQQANNNTSDILPDSTTASGNQQQKQKRLLKADKKLLNHLTSSDDVSFKNKIKYFNR